MRTKANKEKGRTVQTPSAKKEFGKYKGENDKAIMKAGVEKDETLERLLGLWGRYLTVKKIECDIPEVRESVGVPLEKSISRASCSPSDIEKLSIVFANMQPEFIPVFGDGEYEAFFLYQANFLDKLIDSGKDKDYLIHSGNEFGALTSIGLQNRKNIIVEGNVGNYTGILMKAGHIIIRGSAGRDLGRYMVGGIITVEGDVRGRVGKGMTDGEIHLNGKFQGISKRIKGGRIYHRGELIYPKEDKG